MNFRNQVLSQLNYNFGYVNSHKNALIGQRKRWVISNRKRPNNRVGGSGLFFHPLDHWAMPYSFRLVWSGFSGFELLADIPTLSDFTAQRPVFFTVHIKQ